jgi:hypothetical protein
MFNLTKSQMAMVLGGSVALATTVNSYFDKAEDTTLNQPTLIQV